MSDDLSPILVYGTRWCPDSLRAQRLLEREGVVFHYVDIDENSEGAALVQRTNRGNRSVPTIFFPDGAVFVEPGGSLLRAKVVELRELGLISGPGTDARAV
jgi:mycoredoxin